MQDKEGKTFVASNLALSLSAARKKVLLIDLDLRNPDLGRLFDVNANSKGVVNYLNDVKLSLADIIQRNVKGSSLDLISAGINIKNPAELLIEARLDSLFEELRSEYDYIVIDSSSLSSVSDTFALNRLSDMTLFVTRIDYTPKTSVAIIENLAENNRFKNVSLVVNETIG